jgi:hypothetical protein
LGGLLAVSRIDPASGVEYLLVFNNGAAPTRVTVSTATPQARWTSLLGGAPATSDAAAKVTVDVPATGAVALRAGSAVPAEAPSKPRLAVAGDDLSNLWAVKATVGSTVPVSVAFVVRRAGAATWQRLAVDTSPPYRGFLDPAKFGKDERVQLAAITRSLDGRTAISQVLAFRVRRR